MTESFAIQCPHCHAQGDLYDRNLLGKPIICPACQVVFTAPLPPPAPLPPTVMPVAPAEPVVANFEVGGVGKETSPTAVPDFMKPPESPGEAEVMFASSLPQPMARGSIKPPKPKSIVLTTVVWSTVSSIVLFAAFMFLMGDPWRGYDAKFKALEVEAAKQKKRVVLPALPPQERSREEAWERIRAMTAPADAVASKTTPEQMPAVASVDPPDTATMPETIDKPIDVTPAPEVAVETVASALAPENVITDESVLRALTNEATYRDLVNQLRDDPATQLPRLVRFLANPDDDAIHERAWDVLVVLADEKSWRRELRRLLDEDDVSGQITAALILERRLPRRGNPEMAAIRLTSWLTRGLGHAEAALLMVDVGPGASHCVVDLLSDPALPADLQDRLEEFVVNQSTNYKNRLLGNLSIVVQAEKSAKQQLAALTIARLNPSARRCSPDPAEAAKQDPELLPLIEQCLDENDPTRRLRAARVLKMMSEAEVDVSSVIPLAMKLLLVSPAESDDQTASDERLRVAIVELLRVTGIRSEYLPQLRQALRNAVELSLNAEFAEHHQFQIVNYGSSVLRTLALLETEAAEAIPEIKGFLEVAPGVDWSQPLFAIGQPAIAMLIDLARQADQKPEVRVSAIRMVGRLALDDVTAKDALIEHLQNAHIDSRTEAALAVVRNGILEQQEAAVAVLKESLHAGNETHRAAAISQLATLGSQGATAVPDLIGLIKSEDAKPWERQAAAKAILSIAPDEPTTHDAYVEYLKTQPSDFFDATFATYGERLVGRLSDCLREENDSLRIRAAGLLGLLGEKAAPATDALRDLLKSENAHVRTTAAISLARIDSNARDAIPILLEAMENRMPGAVDAMHHLGPNTEEALPKLLDMIDSRIVPSDVIYVIGSMGAAAKPAIPVLVDALQDRRLDQVALYALSELGDHAADAIPALIELIRNHQGPRNLPLVLPRLGPAGIAAALPFCEDLQNEDELLTKLERLQFLGNAAAPAVPRLLELAKSNDPELRIAALKALCSIESSGSESVPVLADGLSDPDPRIAVAAVNGLASLTAHAGPALPQIISALEQNRKSTLPTLIQILAQLGPAASDAVPTLSKLAASRDLEIRRVIRSALKKIENQQKLDARP